MGAIPDFETAMQVIKELEAQLARHEAPVSDEECINFGWMIGDRYRFDPENVDAMIAHRAKPQKGEGNG